MVISRELVKNKGEFMGTKRTDKKIRLHKFLCVAFMYVVIVISVYSMITKFHLFPVRGKDICFSLYMGFFWEVSILVLHYLKGRKEDRDSIQIMLQPFVILSTFWGYILDEFKEHRNWVIATATIVLIVSFLVNLMDYAKRQKKKTVDVTIEKTSTVYEVVLVNGKGIENHYRVTVRK